MNRPLSDQTRPILRTAALISCAVLVSTIVFSILIAIFRHFAIGSASLDYAALAVSVVFGMIFVWRVPCRVSVRALLSVVLATALAVWLVFYGFGFVCTVYRDCL